MPSAQRKTSILALALVSATCITLSGAPAISATAKPGLAQRITRLEESAFGGTHREKALEIRLEALEINTLGHRQSGNITSRLSSLEHLIGNHTAKMMPALAPALAPPLPLSRTFNTDTGNIDTGNTDSHNIETSSETTRSTPAAAIDQTNDLYTAPAGLPENNAPSASTPAPETIARFSQGRPLRGSATEYDTTRAPLSPVDNPLTAPLIPGRQPNYGNVQNNAYNGSVNSNQTNSRHALAPTVKSLVLNQGYNALSRMTPGVGGTALQMLHCPLCRLLQH